ncbi:hypothetical protein [Humisphaera borealis]|uniref:Uncharacterized protein n=1 Tax=Humisphaera borealis TaxID=2807512 RepID=A0A7M2WPK0_9BACT|nr:hypothetical protein [Humisphaera borealis]QOV87398.1 hypothetical protein IPV69_13970 [Humisphaera borealis]
MKWNKQQKIAVGLLGVAVAAFLGDRFVLGGGSAEEDLLIAPTGSTALVGSAGGSRTQSGGPVIASASLPMAALARKMEEICAAEGLKPGHSGDAFAPPPQWFPEAPALADGTAAPVVSSRAAEFRSKYKLTAVMRSGATQGLAVIHGDTVRVGESFKGFKVKAVRDRSVLLTDGTEDFELELPDVGLAAAR